MELRIYMRRECHLCAEAIELAAELSERFDFAVEAIDIESDDDLHRRYLEAIPVVEIDGVERLRVDEFRRGGLERALSASY